MTDKQWYEKKLEELNDDGQEEIVGKEEEKEKGKSAVEDCKIRGFKKFLHQ